MADRIAAMREGAIEQIGSPAEVYQSPRNLYVAQFLGEPPINVLHCRIEQRPGEPAVCMLGGGSLALRRGVRGNGPAILAVRPHHVLLSHHAGHDTASAKVADIENLGSEHVLHLDYAGQHPPMTAPRYAAVGDTVEVSFDLSQAHLIDPASGLVLASGLREASP